MYNTPQEISTSKIILSVTGAWHKLLITGYCTFLFRKKRRYKCASCITHTNIYIQSPCFILLTWKYYIHGYCFKRLYHKFNIEHKPSIHLRYTVDRFGLIPNNYQQTVEVNKISIRIEISKHFGNSLTKLKRTVQCGNLNAYISPCVCVCVRARARCGELRVVLTTKISTFYRLHKMNIPECCCFYTLFTDTNIEL